MVELKKLLLKIVRLLEHLKKDGLIQDYALIGGMAVAARGFPRATKDLDFLINSDEDFFRKEFAKKLKDEGYNVELYKGQFDDPLRALIRIFDNHKNPLVDFILIHWKWQETIIDSAEKLSLGNIFVPIAKTEDLVVLKLKASSPRDLLDVEELLKIASYSGQLDKSRLISLAKSAGVDKKLRQLLLSLKIT